MKLFTIRTKVLRIPTGTITYTKTWHLNELFSFKRKNKLIYTTSEGKFTPKDFK